MLVHHALQALCRSQSSWSCALPWARAQPALEGGGCRPVGVQGGVASMHFSAQRRCCRRAWRPCRQLPGWAAGWGPGRRRQANASSPCRQPPWRLRPRLPLARVYGVGRVSGGWQWRGGMGMGSVVMVVGRPIGPIGPGAVGQPREGRAGDRSVPCGGRLLVLLVLLLGTVYPPGAGAGPRRLYVGRGGAVGGGVRRAGVGLLWWGSSSRRGRGPRSWQGRGLAVAVVSCSRQVPWGAPGVPAVQR
jgi:hypothetical protein